jgi:hypothetical protein
MTCLRQDNLKIEFILIFKNLNKLYTELCCIVTTIRLISLQQATAGFIWLLVFFSF